jgi:four helix bundle protein
LVLEVIGQLPKGHAELADQLLRAAQSQPRNIAEGAGGSGVGHARGIDLLEGIVAMLTKMT